MLLGTYISSSPQTFLPTIDRAEFRMQSIKSRFERSLGFCIFVSLISPGQVWALRCGGLRWTPDKCGLIWECFYLERRCVSLWCAAGYSSQGHSALAQVCRTFGAPATRLNFKIYQTRWQNQPTAKFIFTPGLSWEIKIPTQTQLSRCWKISY